LTNTRHRFSFFYQSASAVDAFSCPSQDRFDDFTLTHTKSPVIQAEDYYPFGLAETRMNTFMKILFSVSVLFLFDSCQTRTISISGLNSDTLSYGELP
jgi:hypothetical protein